MDHEIIGTAAGAVWHQLNEAGNEGVTMSSLKRIDGLRADQAAMAVGWLAREGRLSFASVKNTVRISLVEAERSCSAWV